jgi:hypothetical protein
MLERVLQASLPSSSPRKRESSVFSMGKHWIPDCAGMTPVEMDAPATSYVSFR